MKLTAILPSFLRSPKKGYFYIKADGTVEIITSRKRAFSQRLQENVQSFLILLLSPLN